MRIELNVWGYQDVDDVDDLNQADRRIGKDIQDLGNKLGLKFRETGSGYGFGERDRSFVASVPENKLVLLEKALTNMAKASKKTKGMRGMDSIVSIGKRKTRIEIHKQGGLELITKDRDFELDLRTA